MEVENVDVPEKLQAFMRMCLHGTFHTEEEFDELCEKFGIDFDDYCEVEEWFLCLGVELYD